MPSDGEPSAGTNAVKRRCRRVYRIGVAAAPTRVLALLLGLLVSACGAGGHEVGMRSTSSQESGPPAKGTRAPDFSLTDQFGDREHLSDLRGRVVLLTFIDSHCTTICPLTAELMTKTERTLGPRYPVELLAINANPNFTAVSDVRSWSSRHRMLHRWLFLTAPLPELKAVWNSYGITDKVVGGDVAHTAVIFLIDPAGRVRALIPIAQRRGIDAEVPSIARAVRMVAAERA
jgi:cytochrome oxidase Cu insertion factor (SCO1/SenC/PrrC family)